MTRQKIWLHEFNYLFSKGRVKVTCKPCGVSSPWMPDVGDRTEMAKWCNSHQKLKFLDPKDN